MKPYYEKDGIALYLGDCRDVVPTLPRGDAGPHMLLTDPPYGVEASTTNHRQRTQLTKSSIVNDTAADRPIVEAGVLAAWRSIRLQRHAYVFGPFDLGTLPHASGVTEMVWDKISFSMGDLSLPWGRAHERLSFAVKKEGAVSAKRGGGAGRIRRGTVLRFQRPNATGAKLHPNEKPVPLLRVLIEMSSRHGETVLDPFVGAGSTLVAAKLESRCAIGIEIDECWCEIAAKRLEETAAPPSVIEGLPMTGWDLASIASTHESAREDDR